MSKGTAQSKYVPLMYGLIAAVTLLLRLQAQYREVSRAEILWLFFLCGVLIALLLKREGLRALCVSPACLVGAAVLALSAFFSFILHSHTLQGRLLLKALVTLIVFAAHALLFQALKKLSVGLLFGPQEKGAHLRPLSLLTLGAVLLLVLVWEYLPYYPYGFSGDSLNQWDQIHGAVPYNTIHAIGHTIFLKGLLRLWDSYTAVVWFQLLAVTGFYLCLTDFFYSRGLSLPLIGFVLLMCLIWTDAATRAYFYPWKDTPAALCLGIVTLLLARLSEADRPLGLAEAVLLGTALAWCFLFRLNGVIALVVCGVCCVVLFWKRRCTRQLLAMLLAVQISVGGVCLYSSLVLRPQKLDNGFALQLFGTAIAAVVHEDSLTAKELEEIGRLLPVDWMREQYGNSRDKRDLLWNENGSEQIREDPTKQVLNNDFIIRMGENKLGVIRLFFRLLPRHFPTMAKDLLGSMAIVFLQDSLLFTASNIFWMAAVFWAVLESRLRGPALLPVLPVLCNTVSIMLSAATNEMRYLLPSFLLAPFFVFYFIWQGKKAE